MQNCVNSTLPDLDVLKGGSEVPHPEIFCKNQSCKNPAILDTLYELIGLHIEVNSGVAIRGISEYIKICIMW